MPCRLLRALQSVDAFGFKFAAFSGVFRFIRTGLGDLIITQKGLLWVIGNTYLFLGRKFNTVVYAERCMYMVYRYLHRGKDAIDTADRLILIRIAASYYVYMMFVETWSVCWRWFKFLCIPSEIKIDERYLPGRLQLNLMHISCLFLKLPNLKK